MSLLKNLRDNAPEVFLVTLYFLLETVGASLTESALPVGLVEWGLGLILLAAVSLLVLPVLSRPGIPEPIVPLLVSGVLGAKLWAVTGHRAAILPFLIVILAPLIVWGLLKRWTSDTSRRQAWAALAAVTIVMSTDVLKVLWLQLSGRGVSRGIRGALLLGLLVLVMGGIVLVWDWLRRPIARRPASSAVTLAAAVLIAGTLFAATANPPDDEPWKVQGLPSPANLPNIVLISVDTLRWDMVPPRADSLRLPHLEELRNDSIDFTRAYSNSTWSLPAHASLMTGLLPVEHGALNHRTKIRDSVTFYPEFLSEIGYRTAGFVGGIMLDHHFGFNRGFDVYWENRDPPPFLHGYRNFTPGPLELLMTLSHRYFGGPPVEIRHRTPDRSPLGDRRGHFFAPNLKGARMWLDHLSPDPSPFFLFLHTYEVHDRNQEFDAHFRKLKQRHPKLARALRRVREDTGSFRGRPLDDSAWREFTRELPSELSDRDRRRFRWIWNRISDDVKQYLRERLGGLSRPRRVDLLWRITNQRRVHWDSFRELPSAEKQSRIDSLLRKIHRGEGKTYWRARKQMYGFRIESVDHSLGQFLDWLRRRDLYEDTLIVFLSDHGEGFRLEADMYDHAKGSLEEVLVRVPLWIKLPGNPSGGRSVSSLVSLSDVFPVMFNHLGLPDPCSAGSCRDRSFRDDTGPIPLPDRDHVRYSIDHQIYANEPLPGGGIPLQMGVGTDRFKRIFWSNTKRESTWQIYPETIIQHRLRPDELPEGERRRLDGAMEQYRTIRREASRQADTAAPEMDQELRNELKGAGYL